MSDGLCQCGCGEKAPISPNTDAKLGYVKGEPRRFINGHHRRKSPHFYTVDPDTGCWNWAGGLSGGGYGLHWDRVAKRKIPAHRAYYIEAKGVIPEGLEIDHLCGNRRCVNPDHLEAVPRVVNLRRGRQTKLTEDQVRRIWRMHEGGISLARIGAYFGVTHACIHAIIRGKSWRDVR